MHATKIQNGDIAQPSEEIIEAVETTDHCDLSVTEIAEETSLSRHQIYRRLPTLLEAGRVEKAREIGHIKMYTVNHE
jgi:DNA-binding IclR family transcriptional regulator